jgi:hypothetical protein
VRVYHCCLLRRFSPQFAGVLANSDKAPDRALIGFPHAAELPAVGWKLDNLGRMSAAKRREAYEGLEPILRG